MALSSSIKTIRSRCFYAVGRGWVTLTRESADGNPTVIGVFTTGGSFAEAAILSS
jgi:CRP-like cAMP-binding protein